MNHNSISPTLSDEITNNFLGNPIGTGLTGKVHAKDMGTDMTCFLTYNDKVSMTQYSKISTICKSLSLNKKVTQSVKNNLKNFLNFVKVIIGH